MNEKQNPLVKTYVGIQSSLAYVEVQDTSKDFHHIHLRIMKFINILKTSQ